MKLRRGGAAAIVLGPFPALGHSHRTSCRAGSSAALARASQGPISLLGGSDQTRAINNGPPVPPAPPRRRRRGPQRERLDGDGQALAERDARGAPRPRREEVKGLVDGGGVAVVAVAVAFHGGARAHAAAINGTGRRRGGPGFSADQLGAAQFASGAHPAARAAARGAAAAEDPASASEGAAGAPRDGPARSTFVTRYLYAVCA